VVSSADSAAACMLSSSRYIPKQLNQCRSINMASGNGAVVRKVIAVHACIMLVICMLSMGPPVMGDIQNDCRAICIPKCNTLASDGCNIIIQVAPTLLNLLPMCEVRIAQLCLTLCMNVCTLNTLSPPAPTPAPPAGTAPPPCKP
jgi:hypothetical protein